MRLTRKLLNSLIVRQNSYTRNSVIISLSENHELQEEFAKFRNFVLTECQDIDEDVIQRPKQLHITICAFNISNEYEVLKSRILLKDCLEKRIQQLLNNKPLRVQIKGLDVWSGDLSRAHILYAKVNEPSNKLQTIANSIANEFNEFRIFNKSYFEKQSYIKLHLTLMNTEFPQRIAYNYLKALCETNRIINNGFQDYDVFDDFKTPKRIPFDARKIFHKYRDHLFCDFIIKNIDFNQKKDNEMFKNLESIQLPQHM